MNAAEASPPGLPWVDRLVRLVAAASAWLFLLLVLAVVAQVVLRKFFQAPQVWLEELHWHLHGAIFLAGLAYALIDDAHMRVDVLSRRWSPRLRAGIDAAAQLLLVLPLAALVVWKGGGLAWDSFARGDRSELSAGLPWRWLIPRRAAVGVRPAGAGVAVAAGGGAAPRGRERMIGEKLNHEEHEGHEADMVAPIAGRCRGLHRSPFVCSVVDTSPLPG
jgi:TRAP-type mannitol/chloroaromatic compound transport system permease small subunit